MDALGDELIKYIEEAEKGKEEEKEDKPKRSAFDILEPFTAVGKGIIDVAKAIMPTLPASKSSDGSGSDSKKAGDAAKSMLFTAYDVFKKAQGMLSW